MEAGPSRRNPIGPKGCGGMAPLPLPLLLANAQTLTRRRFAKIGAVALATIAMLFRERATRSLTSRKEQIRNLERASVVGQTLSITKSSRRSAKAAWGRCTWLKTAAWIEKSPSRFFLSTYRQFMHVVTTYVAE